MSISPPGDLVLDVLRAADPRSGALATLRLERLAERADLDFAMEMTKRAPTAPARASNLSSVDAPQVRAVGPRRDGIEEPAVALGAILLKQMVEHMMPRNGPATGGGSAGALWRSTLAERLSAAVAPTVFGTSAFADAARTRVGTPRAARDNAG